MAPFIVALIACLCMAQPALSANWPQYQGPQRNGISQEKGILKSWPQGGPQALWRVPFHEGYSGLAVVGGRIYTMYGKGDDEYAACLDASDGSEIWKVRTDRNRPDQFGGGPRATPTVHQGLVYTTSARNVIHAIDAQTGAIRWVKDLKRQYGAGVPTWGASGSPLIEGNLVIVEAGGRSGKALLAFDKKTGREVWSSHTAKQAYSSPVAATIAGQRQILFATGDGLLGAAVEDGRVLWTTPWVTSYGVNAATPLLVGSDKVFYSSSYGKGAVLLRISRDGDSWQVGEVWRSRVMKNHFHSSILYGGHIYGFDDGILKCIEAASGQQKWRARGYQKGAMILADGHLIILGERGHLGLVEANPERFVQKGRVRMLKGKCWTNPTLASGVLYLRNQTEMVALKFAQE